MRRDAEEHNRELKAQIKGVNTHLNDIDAWKRSVDSQLGHLASIIPRAAGNLPGKIEENPMGHHIATMNLRSERNLPDLVPDSTTFVPDGTI